MVSINVLTNDKHLWLLKGFSYLFNKFWSSQKVNIWGFGYPEFELPDNFIFHSLADNNYPAQRWSTALIEMCHQIEDDYFILMLEDYWLISQVQKRAAKAMCDYIYGKDDILRIDLSGNRAAYVQAKGYDTTLSYSSDAPKVVNGTYKIVQTPMHTPYQMSFQAAIWNKRLLLSILKEDETPWEVEINGSARLRTKEDMLVLGAKDTLLRYVPVYRTQGHRLLLEKIPKRLVQELQKEGCLQ